jgi:hypothetical protein
MAETAIEKLTEAVNRLAAAHEATERRVSAHFAQANEDDGQDGKATAIVQSHPDLSIDNVVATLAAQGIRRTRDWVRMTKVKLGQPVGMKPKRH